jgi:hypothetical protein
MSGTRPPLRHAFMACTETIHTSFDPFRCGSCCHVQLADLLQLAHSKYAKVLAPLVLGILLVPFCATLPSFVCRFPKSALNDR